MPRELPPRVEDMDSHCLVLSDDDICQNQCDSAMLFATSAKFFLVRSTVLTVVFCYFFSNSDFFCYTVGGHILTQKLMGQ